MGLLRDWLIDPISLLFMLSLLVWLTVNGGARRLRWAIGVWIAGVLLISAPVLVNPLVALLEEQVQASDINCTPASPIVVLGGGVDSRVRHADEFERMSDDTLARVAAVLRLSEKHADVPIVLTGGALGAVSEAEVMASFLQRMGVDQRRMWLEPRAQNTADNAVLVAEILSQLSADRPVFLVTSALHMLRAQASFARHSITVCPVPVGYQALKNVPLYAWVPQSSARAKFDKLLHELVALLIYRLTDKI